MNAVLLSPCVKSMPIAKTPAALIVVPVKLDLLETGKRALVREEKNSEVSISKVSHFFKKKTVSRIGADPGFFLRTECTTVLLQHQ